MGVIIFAAVGIVAVFVSIGILLYNHRYVRKAFNAMDTVLDRILAKKYAAPVESTRDDRISKLTHKANNVLEMCRAELTQTQGEKELIQGFISDMSHQMKTPLASIAMYTELLQGSTEILSAKEYQDFLARIKSGAAKLEWMTESLIKMSRLEVGTITLNPAPIYVKSTITEAIGTAMPLAAKKNVTIKVAEPFEDRPLLHDRKWTAEALGNILENAVKYSPQGGNIEISVEPLQMFTKITVTDQGIGINKNDLHLIFKRFHRGQNAKNKEGVGLGLYLATVIMEKQGGYIMVDSALGKGAAFSLFLQSVKIHNLVEEGLA